MRHLFISFLIFSFANSVSGQVETDNDSKALENRRIKGDSVRLFIDSLRLSIFRDTAKFNRKDLVNLNGGTKNTKPYSMLITIDWRYSYRLDIIDGELVSDFVREILNPSKIEAIYVIKKSNGLELFGSQGEDGCILISLKPKTKINFKVAGLKYDKKLKRGNNFNQSREGEIMIRT